MFFPLVIEYSLIASSFDKNFYTLIEKLLVLFSVSYSMNI